MTPHGLLSIWPLQTSGGQRDGLRHAEWRSLPVGQAHTRTPQKALRSSPCGFQKYGTVISQIPGHRFH